ncbi:MAG: aldehyde dehydrogenase family protein, partial [Pseudomonadota bacterium]
MTEQPLDYLPLLHRLRSTFNAGRTRDLRWRRRQLDALIRMLNDHEAEILEAMHQDFGKPAQEAFLAEVGFVTSEARYVRSRMERWSRIRPVETPMIGQPGRSHVQPEPLGVVLIIGAWNYPVQLVLAPLVAALAAGNCAILKPSELTEHTSALIAQMVPRYLDQDAVSVVEGGVPETSVLLELKFDHVFYTGGAAVGKIVMKAAAEHLTPVTLELGGKSPAIVDRGADLKSAARRLIWGKILNAGQTCVAPDYVLVQPDQREPLLAHMQTALTDMLGANVLDSGDFASIVNQR